MNLKIITAYDDKFAEVGDYCAKSIKEYAEKHGYDYEIYKDIPQDRHPVWYKMPLIKKSLSTHEFVLWIDADAVITNMEFNIESIIRDGYDIFLSKDILGINFGITLWRSSQMTVELMDGLSSMYDVYDKTLFKEQAAFSDLWKTKVFIRKRTLFIEQALFNAYLYGEYKNYYPQGYPQGEWQEGYSFALHLPGMENGRRVQILSSRSVKDNKNKLTVFHSGNLGDVIYSIPTAKCLGATTYILDVGHCFGTNLTRHSCQLIKPLLESQGFEVIVDKFKQYPLKMPQGYNFDSIRYYGGDLNKRHLAVHYAALAGVLPNLSVSFLENIQPQYLADIVIHRSSRYHNPWFDWDALLKLFHSQNKSILFIGDIEEYRALSTICGDTPITFHPAVNLLEAAEIIKGCKLFIGNQSSPFAIAEGLKVDRVQETYPPIPNCLPQSSNGEGVLYPKDFANLIRKYKSPQQSGLDIVIPMKDNIAYTIQCINSILNMKTKAHYHITIVDDHSSPQTIALLKDTLGSSANEVSVVFSDRAPGFASACNYGADQLEESDNKFILFLNNDTIMANSGSIDNMISEILSSEDISIVSPLLLYPGTDYIQSTWMWHGKDQNDNINAYHAYRFYKYAECMDAHTSKDVAIVTGAALLIRKKDFSDVGGFNEDYKNGAEDIDLSFRIRSMGKKIRYCSAAKIYHYESATTGVQSNKENLELLNKKWRSIYPSEKNAVDTRNDLINQHKLLQYAIKFIFPKIKKPRSI